MPNQEKNDEDYEEFYSKKITDIVKFLKNEGAKEMNIEKMIKKIKIV
jgi:hypothetical protein